MHLSSQWIRIASIKTRSTGVYSRYGLTHLLPYHFPQPSEQKSSIFHRTRQHIRWRLFSHPEITKSRSFLQSITINSRDSQTHLCQPQHCCSESICKRESMLEIRSKSKSSLQKWVITKNIQNSLQTKNLAIHWTASPLLRQLQQSKRQIEHRTRRRCES